MDNVRYLVMDKEALRKRNLNLLIAKFGTHQSLAEEVGVSPGYVSQIVSGHRPFSEKTARKWEKELKLSPGYMDVVHDLEPPEKLLSDDLESSIDGELAYQLNQVVSLYMQASTAARDYVKEILSRDISN